MSADIVWAEPPADGRSTGRKPDQRSEAMRANPGRWLLWSEHCGASMGTYLRRRGFETLRRGTALYARWPETPGGAA